MKEWREIKRTEDVMDGDPFHNTTEDVECMKCGKTMTLWFNGGELDWRECCGFKYQLEHKQIALVVYEEDG